MSRVEPLVELVSLLRLAVCIHWHNSQVFGKKIYVALLRNVSIVQDSPIPYDTASMRVKVTPYVLSVKKFIFFLPLVSCG